MQHAINRVLRRVGVTTVVLTAVGFEIVGEIVNQTKLE
jgi:hypothetical protein